MNINIKVILAASATAALLSGCTSQPLVPNNATQAGAATGALAGAIIGYNTQGHDKGTRMAIGTALGAATGAAVGYAIDEQSPKQVQSGGWQ